jgi:hypothetical protein
MSVDYRLIARQKAAKYGLLPDVFERQIDQESGFNPAARSRAGAIGIAQIMPSTARGWGVNPSDPVAALDSAAKNMAGYIKTFGGMNTQDPYKVRSAYEKGLQAYNAGPGSVGRYMPAETKDYISKIIGPDKFSFTKALQPSVVLPQAPTPPPGVGQTLSSLLGQDVTQSQQQQQPQTLAQKLLSEFKANILQNILPQGLLGTLTLPPVIGGL